MTKHFVLATLLSCGALLRKVDKPLKYKKAVNNLVLKKKTNKPDSSTSMENQGQLFSNLPEFFAANFIPTLVSRARFALLRDLLPLLWGNIRNNSFFMRFEYY